MKELNSFEKLIDVANKVIEEQKELRGHYDGILDETISEEISLPDNLYDTRYYKVYRDLILDDALDIRGRGVYCILGVRETGKTVLAKRLHNLVYRNSIFISLAESRRISVDELIEFLVQKKSGNIDFLFIDEITYLTDMHNLKRFYEFVNTNFKRVFFTATESLKLAEWSIEYLGNRIQFIPAGADAVSIHYFNFLNRESEKQSRNPDTRYKGTLTEYINSCSDSDASKNLNVSLQSKLDSFLLQGSSLIKDRLKDISDLSIKELFYVLIHYKGRSFNIREYMISAMLLFTHYNVIGMKGSAKTKIIDNFIENSYMPAENTSSYKELVERIGNRSVAQYYSDMLKEIGVFTEITTYYNTHTTKDSSGINGSLDELKIEISTLCASVDLVGEFLWAIKNKKQNFPIKLSINLDRANGLFTESIFCSILLEVLGIGNGNSLDENLSVYKLKYKKDYTDYEIDCVVDYDKTHRIFIGVKIGKPDIEESLKNIPGFNPLNDRIVVVSASHEDMEYNYNSGICKLSVKQFFKEYLPSWVRDMKEQ